MDQSCKLKPDLEGAFAALDAASLPPDFLAERDRRPPQERPELESLFEEDTARKGSKWRGIQLIKVRFVYERCIDKDSYADSTRSLLCPITYILYRAALLQSFSGSPIPFRKLSSA